eukprot:scaffold84609_cov52-Attheya_sp.AAC.2
MRQSRTETTPSSRKKPGPRPDNEDKSKSSSSRKEITKQPIEKEKKALMSSDEENDNVEVGGRKTAVAAASAKKTIILQCMIQAKNKELEAEIKLLNEKDKDWEALNADTVDVISELRERVATLNKIASSLEADVRVAQGHAHHAQNNSIDTTIEMDASGVQLCPEDYVQKGAKTMYEDNNGIMPTLDEVLLLREEPIWDPEDDCRIVNNIGFLFIVDFMYGSIIGKRQWKKDKFIIRLSSDMTISDEAFVLLVLENNWDVLNGVTNAEPKYTSRKFTSNKGNDGWSNEGII